VVVQEKTVLRAAVVQIVGRDVPVPLVQLVAQVRTALLVAQGSIARMVAQEPTVTVLRQHLNAMVR
jgi:hypothetical protein